MGIYGEKLWDPLTKNYFTTVCDITNLPHVISFPDRCSVHSLTPKTINWPPWKCGIQLSPEQLIQLNSWSSLLNQRKIFVFSLVLSWKEIMKEMLSIIYHTCRFKPASFIYMYHVCFLVEWMLRICINNNYRTIQSFPIYSIIFVYCAIIDLCWKHTLQICSVD